MQNINIESAFDCFKTADMLGNPHITYSRRDGGYPDASASATWAPYLTIGGANLNLQIGQFDGKRQDIMHNYNTASSLAHMRPQGDALMKGVPAGNYDSFLSKSKYSNQYLLRN